MTRKVGGVKLGKGIEREQRRRVENNRKAVAEVAGISKEQASRSVLEQSSLDELVATVQLKKEEWADSFGEAEIVQDGPVLLDKTQPLIEVENAAAERRELISIPRRPQWEEGMTSEELAALETQAFIEWRRGFKDLEQDEGFVVTPYERNLDFWRQLWRCIERSDLLVQVLDARDPDFYFCQDLSRYLRELGGSKRLMLLVNKADFLTAEQRLDWEAHFAARGVDAVFFSALRELQKQQRLQASSAEDIAAEADTTDDVDAFDTPLPDSDDEAAKGADAEETAGARNVRADDAQDTGEAEADEVDSQGVPELELSMTWVGVADVPRLLEEIRKRLPGKADDCASASETASVAAASEASARPKRGTVGFVGYPNVGKSTVINALVGAKKVGMSRTPGKTKHIQTLDLPEWGFTLCDAPGLVFPSVVATRAHLVINNTVPLDDLRECFSPISLIVRKIGFQKILERYKCAAFVKDAALRSGDHVLDAAHSFLAAFAVSRNHFLRVGVPDENWAARKVLRDYVTGQLLHCEPPPRPAVEDADAANTSRRDEEECLAGVDDDEDFDIDDIIGDGGESTTQPRMTKRAARKQNKQMMKGAPMQSAQQAMKVRSRGRAIW
mmetsp:Transcript_155662/g.290544  ORF Transcript_155662/g.290544 Transcript_155662/m.290544 type:complete len:615 (-) Transcript_155662:121-1965(-)